MNAGKLRHRITIQQKAVTPQDVYGAEPETWSTLATVWGSVEPMRGQEFLESQRLGAEVDTRIRIRYYSGVTPAMRVVYGSHTYNIQAVIDVEERHREVQLMCREVVS